MFNTAEDFLSSMSQLLIKVKSFGAIDDKPSQKHKNTAPPMDSSRISKSDDANEELLHTVNQLKEKHFKKCTLSNRGGMKAMSHQTYH